MSEGRWPRALGYLRSLDDDAHTRTQALDSLYRSRLHLECTQVVLTVGFGGLPHGIAALLPNFMMQ